MKNINWFVVMIIGIWFFATIACFATKNSEPIGAAAIITLAAGFAYCILKG